jgi:hypothetical protein
VNKQELLRLAGTVDAFCARLNAGLTAVAILLAVVVAGVAMVQMPQLLQPLAQAEDTIPFSTGL